MPLYHACRLDLFVGTLKFEAGIDIVAVERIAAEVEVVVAVDIGLGLDYRSGVVGIAAVAAAGSNHKTVNAATAAGVGHLSNHETVNAVIVVEVAGLVVVEERTYYLVVVAVGEHKCY